MQALFTPKQTSARMEYLRTSGRLVAKKPLIVLNIVLKTLHIVWARIVQTQYNNERNNKHWHT